MVTQLNTNKNINVSSISNTCAFDMTGANVNLTLVGENRLRSGSNRAGLETPDGSTLVITGASTGSLTATGGSSGAGIGGGSSGTGGTIDAIGGNAVIFASSIQLDLPSGSNRGPAIIFIGNNGTMYGNVTLQQNVTFASGRILPISAGQSLTIPSGVTLTNNGTIIKKGIIIGTVTGNQPIDTIQLLNANSWINGNILSSGGDQWFKFTANASTQYIRVSFGALTNLYVQLYDSNFNTVGSQANLYASTRYTSRTVTIGEEYYIRVWPYYSSGTYRIAFNGSVTAPEW